MNKKLSLWIVLCLLGLQDVYAQSQPEYFTNRVIVKLRKGLVLPNQEQLIWEQLPGNDAIVDVSAIDLLPRGSKGSDQVNADFFSSIYKIQVSSNQDLEAFIREYQATGLFEFVEPDYVAHHAGKTTGEALRPNDPYYYNRQWSHYNDGTFSTLPSRNDADIDMDEAWQIEQGDTNVIVAILDTGINPGHPEFNGRLWRNKLENPNDNADNDQNGYLNDIYGWDFINQDNQPMDDHGHGTNVSGLLAATGNNSMGYAGVDWNCKLMVCKVLDAQGTGAYSNIAQGIIYAVNQGAHVINMSLGGSGNSQLLRDAIEYAQQNNVVVVASMMNFNNSTPYFPAAYPSTIAVGSTDPDDSRSAPFFWSSTSGSNFGNHIDVVAPGNYMYGLHNLNNNYYGSYWGGTSQATPLVAGLASLLIAQKPYIKAEEIREIIRQTAEDQVGDPLEDVSGWDIYHGFGRINAYQALLINKDAPPLRIDQILLVNPNNDQLIKKMLPLDRIGFNAVGGKELSFKADVSIASVGSVYFELKGPMNHTQVENITPYALFGDDPRFDIQGKAFLPGKYSLSVTPYTKANRKGLPGMPMEILFEIVEEISNPLVNFSLIDAETGRELLVLHDGMTINPKQWNTRKFNILVNHQGKQPGSVGIWLEGEFGHQQTENIPPYVLFGDFPQSKIQGEPLCPGNYQIVAIPFSNAYLKGERGQSMNISFNVLGEHRVDRLTLVNAFNNQDIQELPLEGYVVLSLSNLPTKLNIRADAKCAQSVTFLMQKSDQTIIRQHTENLAPFAIWGDDNKGNYYSWYPIPGTYVLTYTPYNRINAQGEAGLSGQLHIEILNQASLNRGIQDSLIVSSNSYEDKVSILLQGQQENSILQVYDHLGRLLIDKTIHAEQAEELSLGQYGKGLYILRVWKANRLITRKVYIH